MPKRRDGTAAHAFRRPFLVVAGAFGVVAAFFGVLTITTWDGDRHVLLMGVFGIVTGLQAIALSVVSLIFRRPRNGASPFGNDPEQDERDAASWYATHPLAVQDPDAPRTESTTAKR